MRSPEVYRFKNVEVDTLRGRLTCSREVRHLRQQAFAVLVCLIENRERVVSKDELIEKVWNGTAVVDDALVQCIKDIRRALGDDPQRPRFIRTIPKIGYRFISPIAEDIHSLTTTRTEEITHLEFEIEEETLAPRKGLMSMLGSGFRDLIASARAPFVLLFAGAVVVSATVGLFYFAPKRFGVMSADQASAQAMTKNAEALRYYLIGVEKAQAVHSQEAIEYFEKAVELDPEFAMAHARIGYVYALVWGQPEKGRPHLERAAALPGRLTDKDKLHLAAWTAIAEQDYSAAIPPLREIVSKYPLETEAYWRLGRVLTAEGQYEDAIAVLRQGIAADPNAKDIYNFLGGLMSGLGRHDEAIPLQQRYVELAPAEPNAYDSLGMAYQHSGNYAEAVVQYQRALDLKPDFEVALAHFANTRFQQGRYREAIELYKKYIAAAPSDVERARGYGRLSIIYHRLNDYRRAAEAARIARKYNEEDLALLLLAVERGELSKARDLEDQLLARSRLSSRGMRNDGRIKFYLRGSIALERGQTDEALENFREIGSHLPPTWDLMDFEDALANGYLKTGRYQNSIAEYERILARNPNYPLAHFYLAQALERAGHILSARKNYERFMEVWKDADLDIPELATARKLAG